MNTVDSFLSHDAQIIPFRPSGYLDPAHMESVATLFTLGYGIVIKTVIPSSSRHSALIEASAILPAP